MPWWGRCRLWWWRNPSRSSWRCSWSQGGSSSPSQSFNVAMQPFQLAQGLGVIGSRVDQLHPESPFRLFSNMTSMSCNRPVKHRPLSERTWRGGPVAGGEFEGVRSQVPGDGRTGEGIYTPTSDAQALGAAAALESTGRVGDALVIGHVADVQARTEMANCHSPVKMFDRLLPDRYGEFFLPMLINVLAGRPVEKCVVV